MTRRSRLFTSIPDYITRSLVTMLRVYAMFNPLRLFTVIGTLSFSAGALIGCRFLYFYLLGHGGGKIQSLLLAAVFLLIGAQLFIIGLVSDLISANRRLIEDVLLRVKHIELRHSAERDTLDELRLSRKSGLDTVKRRC